MRWKILIITLFIGVMIIIGTADATPDIGKVKLTKNTDDNKFHVEVEAMGTTDVEVNDNPSTSNGNPYEFTDIEGFQVEREDYELLKIKATDPSSQVSELDIGAGGCTNSYDNMLDPYYDADVYLVPSGQTTTLFLNTDNEPDDSIIGICVYPNPEHTDGNELNIAESLLERYNWLPKISGNYDYFAFGRRQGDKDNILVNGARNIEIGNFAHQENTDYSRILLHVNAPHICGSDTTCWVRPCTTIIPEFPTIAIPIAAVIGLVFFFQHRKKKEE